ncbi:hypothetical protein WICPIJ_004372 [Wickerhamomyces pijperi]|uniref:Uncharacterized protein n=1 Tax=Wickerhamomyces pijperi TaxID=599730 RepID=A0A9P8Q5Z8_WICPI|nr:hypothetical protein WICPIJ_004372 [Wickerhamomyces pijperi]
MMWFHTGDITESLQSLLGDLLGPELRDQLVVVNSLGLTVGIDGTFDFPWSDLLLDTGGWSWSGGFTD